ncbi:MAG: PAS domain S-box protein [Nitrospirae bacterium]|nr:PAS domain S-box protein [Nitrospirota bacterium]
MNILRKLSIGRRLYIGLIAMILSFIVLSSIIIVKFNNIYSLTIMLRDHPLTVSNAIDDVNYDIQKINLKLREMIEFKDPKIIEENIKMIEGSYDDILVRMDILSRQFLGKKEDVLTLKEQIIKWREVNKAICSSIRVGNYDEGQSIFKLNAMKNREKISESVYIISLFAKGKANQFILEAEKTRTHTLRLLSILFFIYTVSGIAIASFLIRSFTIPLRALNKAVLRFCSSNGRDNVEIKVEGADEITQLSSSFNSMTNKLHNLIGHLHLKSEITENISEGVVLIKVSDGNIVYTNAMFDKILGYQQGELIGKNIAVINAPGALTPEETASEIMSVLQRSGTWRGDIENIKKDGSIILCHSIISTFDHHDFGKVWISIHSDITFEKRFNFIQTVLDCIDEGIVACDRNGVFTYFNKSIVNMLGIPKGANAEEIWNNKYYDIYLPDQFGNLGRHLDKKEERPLFMTLSGIEVTNFEFLARRGDGSTLSVISTGRQIKDNFGNITGAVLSIRDITLLKNAENNLKRLYVELEQMVKDRTQELDDANKQYRTLFDTMAQGVVYQTEDGWLISANIAFLDIIGLTLEQFIGRNYIDPIFNILIEDGSPCPLEERPSRKAIRTGEAVRDVVLQIYNHKLNDYVWVLVNAVPQFKDGSERPFQVFTTMQNITEIKKLEESLRTEIAIRKQTEELLKEKEQDVIEAQKKASFGTWSYDPVTQQPKWSMEMFDIWGVDPKDGPPNYSEHKKYIHPDDYKHFDNIVKETLLSGKLRKLELRLCRTDKTERTIITIIEPILDSNGKVVRLRGSNQDITERVEMEKKLRASLKEKELLLGEVYHRVKNNLAVVSSFLSLQRYTIKDPFYVNMFLESENRIRSMSLVHEKLYKSKDMSNVDFSDYIQCLIDTLSRAYNVESGNITIIKEVQDVLLDIDTAIPCGLIINELISNAFKYAFKDNLKGEICVGLHRTDNNEVRLTVRDNGKGLPNGFDIHKTDTLGWQIVTGLAESQLGGKINLNQVKGLEIIIQFKERGSYIK